MSESSRRSTTVGAHKDCGKIARTRFSEVGSAVATRSKNLSTLAADRAAFNAQKDEPGGKKTFKAYLWKVCGDAYDQQHS